MLLLLVHNRYQQPGGEDQVFEAERDMLREAGHEVITYEVHNDAVRGMSRIALFLRTLWNRETSHRIRKLIREHRPAVVHCHNIFPLISPSIYWACRKEGVPVVQTLHNFRLTCLNAYLFRDGKVCERCFGRFPWAGLRYRCYRDSFAASCVATLSWFLHFRILRTYHRAVDRFIVLTEFGRTKMLALGLPADKLVVKPNAIAATTEVTENAGDTNRKSAPSQVLYVGRLSSEKGVDVLIRAWKLVQDRLPAGARLLIVGDGPERAALERLAEGNSTTEHTEYTEREMPGNLATKHTKHTKGEGSNAETQPAPLTSPSAPLRLCGKSQPTPARHSPPRRAEAAAPLTSSSLLSALRPSLPTPSLSPLSALRSSLPTPFPQSRTPAIPQSVRFLGRQPRPQVLELMRSSSLFVLPSLCYETFGIAVCEAMLCACPAVVTDHGAAASLVENGKTGFHVPPGDPEALGKTLIESLADPARLAIMGKHAAEAIRKSDSDPTRNLQRLLEIYRFPPPWPHRQK